MDHESEDIPPKSSSKFLNRIEKRLDGEEQEVLAAIRSSTVAQLSFTGKVKYVLSNATVEPMLLLLDLASSTSGSSSSFLLLEKVCCTEFNYTISQCRSFLYHSDSHVAEQVHDKMADWLMIFKFIYGIPIIIVTLIMTAWSDKYGRKFPIVAPVFFEMLTCIFLVMNVYYFMAPVHFYVLSKIPSAIFGTFLVYPIMLAYLSDISKKRNLAARFMILSIISGLGFIFSHFASGRVFKYGGFYATFGTAIGFYVLAAIYGLVVLKEPASFIESSVRSSIPFKQKLKDAFDVRNAVSGLKVIFKKRPAGLRKYLILIVMLFQIRLQIQIAHPIVLAYLSDISDKRNLAARFMIIFMINELGFILSHFVSGQIFKYGGFYATFGTSIGSYVFAAIYGLVYLKEPNKFIDSSVLLTTPFKQKLKDAFDVTSTFSGLKVIFRKRPAGLRKYLLVLLVIFQIMDQIGTGTSEVSLLFQQLMFKWNMTERVTYSGIVSIMKAIVSILAFLLVIFFLRGKDVLMCFISAIVLTIGYFMMGFSHHEDMYYAGRFIKVWNILGDPGLLSLIFQIVNSDEVGKLIGTVDSIMKVLQLGSGLCYQLIYKASLNFMPGLFFIVSASLMIFPLVVFSYLLASKALEKALLKKDELSKSNIDTEEQTDSSRSLLNK